MYIINAFLRLGTRYKTVGYCTVLSLLSLVVVYNLFSLYFGGLNSVEVINKSDKKPSATKPGAGSSNAQYSDYDDLLTSETNVPDNKHTIFNKDAHKAYLADLFDELSAVKPGFKALPSEYPKAPSYAPWDEHPLLSMKFLSESFLTVTAEQVADLKDKHAKFMAKLKDKTSRLYFSATEKDNFYIPGSSGIVYVGGGKYSWFALLSIQHLRNIGSKLPVEVYIPFEEEYEEEFCEKVLPGLNAKCLKMYEILGDVSKHFEIKGFMLKSLALLLSNFENILLLDADNVPYLNPDILFVSEPYLSHRFIVWPDYWERTTHPAMYEIQGLNLYKLNADLKKDEVFEKKPLHDLKGTIPNPSTESGQLMISKSHQTEVILLSLYYNIYGPDYYYHLLTQWAPGQGDKDTFLAAANLLNATYYQIKTTVRAIGYHHVKNDEFRGTAQGQYSPIDENNFNEFKAKLDKMYEMDFCVQKGITVSQLKNSKVYQQELVEYKEVQKSVYSKFTDKDDKEALKEFYADVFDMKIKLMFVHESTPKFDPVDLILNNQMKEEDRRIRFYDNIITEPGYYKFEKMQWENIYDFLCSSDESKLVRMKFIEQQIERFGDKYKKEEFCKQIQEEIVWIGNL